MKFYIISLIFLLLITTNVSKSQINNLPYCDNKSIWKHAAYSGSNTSFIKNIKSSIDSNYCGIEIDIIYDDKKKSIYISHQKIKNINKKNFYSINKIDQVIKNQEIYLWLDWKNSKLSNLNQALDIIENSMSEYLSNENSLILIETPNIFHNEILNLINKNENIVTLNWLSYNNKQGFIEKIKNIFRYSRAWIYVCFLPDRWVSSPNIEILSLCKNSRKVKSIFIFTINDLQKAKQAFLKGANVILSDFLRQNQILR